MNQILLRSLPHVPRRRAARIVCVALPLLFAGALWHGLIREPLIIASARASVGCVGRADLLSVALQLLYPVKAPMDDPIGQLWTTRTERSGCVLRYRSFVVRELPEPRVRWRGAYAFYDAQLRFQGAVNSASAPSLASADHDGDGAIETTIESWSDSPVGAQPVRRREYRVVRVRPAGNELVGVIVWPAPVSPAGTMTTARAVWKERRDGGMDELHLMSATLTQLPNFSISGVRTLAVFEWNEANGCLRPRQIDDPADVRFWAPPGGVPLPVPSESAIEDAVMTPLRELVESMHRATTQRATSYSASEPDDGASP